MSEMIESIEQYGLSTKDRPKQLFSKVGVVGCGTIGQIIALQIAQKELEVIFIELSQEKINLAMCNIERELDVMIDRWGMTPGEKRAILARIHGFMGYENLKGCDMVIESVLSKTREDRVSLRKDIFKNIEKHVSTDCIIATNSTTLVITELSAELDHKERCVALHFLTNLPNSRMNEVVRGLYTSDEVFDRVCTFVKMLGMTVIKAEESPGLISVRLLVVLLNEACEVLMEQVSTMEDIDRTMQTGFGMPLGPFELADKIGLDKVLRWMENLYNEFGDKKYIASPLIKKYVRAHHYGRKSGKGFYRYDENGKKITE